MLVEPRLAYIERLHEMRLQLRTSSRKPNEHHRLAEATAEYCDSYGQYVREAASPAAATVEEIDTRRQAIDSRFNGSPVQTYPSTELLLSGSALISAVSNAALGRIPTALGLTIVGGVLYLGYLHRKPQPIIHTPIVDTELVANSLQELSDPDITPTPEQCQLVFKATIDSEITASVLTAARILKTRTYTPFGFIRVFTYEAARRRKAKKLESKTGED